MRQPRPLAGVGCTQGLGGGLFESLYCLGQNSLWNRQPECLRGLEVDGHVKSNWLLNMVL